MTEEAAVVSGVLQRLWRFVSGYLTRRRYLPVGRCVVSRHLPCPVEDSRIYVVPALWGSPIFQAAAPQPVPCLADRAMAAPRHLAKIARDVDGPLRCNHRQ